MGKTFIKSPVNGKLYSGSVFEFKNAGSNEKEFINATINSASSSTIWMVDSLEESLIKFTTDTSMTIPKDTVVLIKSPVPTISGGLKNCGKISFSANIINIFIASDDFSIGASDVPPPSVVVPPGNPE